MAVGSKEVIDCSVVLASSPNSVIEMVIRSMVELRTAFSAAICSVTFSMMASVFSLVAAMDAVRVANWPVWAVGAVSLLVTCVCSLSRESMMT